MLFPHCHLHKKAEAAGCEHCRKSHWIPSCRSLSLLLCYQSITDQLVFGFYSLTRHASRSLLVAEIRPFNLFWNKSSLQIFQFPYSVQQNRVRPTKELKDGTKKEIYSLLPACSEKKKSVDWPQMEWSAATFYPVLAPCAVCTWKRKADCCDCEQSPASAWRQRRNFILKWNLQQIGRLIRHRYLCPK